MVVGPHQPRVAVGRDRDPVDGRQAGGIGRGTRAPQQGQGPEGREPQRAADVPFGPAQLGRITVYGGLEDLMVREAGLDQQAATAVAGTDQPGRPGHQGQGLLAGAEPGGQQVLIDVEEGHGVGPGHPVEGRLGAHHQPGLRQAGAVGRIGGPGDLAGGHPGQGGELLGGPGDPDPEGLQPGGVALGAHQRTVVVAAAAPEPSARLVLGHGASAPGAAGQGSAVAAGQEAGPPPAVEDAHRPALGPVEHRVQEAGQSFGEQTGTRIVSGAVHHLHHRPAPSLDRS